MTRLVCLLHQMVKYRADIHIGRVVAHFLLELNRVCVGIEDVIDAKANALPTELGVVAPGWLNLLQFAQEDCHCTQGVYAFNETKRQINVDTFCVHGSPDGYMTGIRGSVSCVKVGQQTGINYLCG
jgi:hypothetical protein